ncbi:hypothetical protein BVRB_7g165850 [Beta vulgaris subsp. vulgaris]|nr:hypothetical protein BVRB_7g165850 [Beta vulgaris subsp. vulgaris]
MWSSNNKKRSFLCIVRPMLSDISNVSPSIQEGKVQLNLCIRHKNKDGTTCWEPIAEKHYEELKKLHETQIQEHGEDNLNVKDAYIKALKCKSEYVRGLVTGARPPKNGRTRENNERLSTQVDTLAASNEELKASNEQLEASNEEFKTSNEELRAEFSNLNKEAIECEKKMREDMLKMFEDMMRYKFFSLFIIILGIINVEIFIV